MLPRKIGNGICGVHDDRDAVSADDVIVQFRVAELKHFRFVFARQTRRAGNVAKTARQRAKAVGGSLGFQIKDGVRMRFFVFGDERRREFLADSV